MRTTPTTRTALILLACSALTACSAADRISKIGEAPEMTKIENPTLQKDYKPVSLPMPALKSAERQKNSLWAADRQTFFKDQRASNVGDIITVSVNIDDTAKLDNETERKRTSTESANVNALLGYEQGLNRVLPEAVDNTNLADLGADSNHKGTGSVDRKEQIEVKVAALVTQILPNGNLVISGRQEVLVNFEKRILQVDGVIRPQDISTTNTVTNDQIAEARIVYAGEGQHNFQSSPLPSRRQMPA